MTVPDQRGTEQGAAPVVDDDKVTLGEVYRRVIELVSWVKGLDAKFDDLDDKYVSRREFDKLEQRVTWTGRAALTGILLPVIVLVIGYLLLGHASSP